MAGFYFYEKFIYYYRSYVDLLCLFKGSEPGAQRVF